MYGNNTQPNYSPSLVGSALPQVNQWIVTPMDRSRHERQFYQLNPVGGKLTGDKARAHFMQYSIPVDILRKIWNLSDLDVDGKLDVNEFTIAMHLIEARLKGVTIPSVLPQSMLPAGGSNRYSSSASAKTDVWAMSNGDKLKYKQMFNKHDTRRMGSLDGVAARNVFLQSGLDKTVLAQVWNLADVDKDGKLSSEEFCIGMHFINIAKSGTALPATLPNSLKLQNRSKSAAASTKVNTEQLRQANYQAGQMELQKRRLMVESQLQAEREAQRARDAEAEKQRRAKLEQLRIQKERKLKAEMELRKRRELEVMKQKETERAILNRVRELEYETQRAEGIRMELKNQRTAEQDSVEQVGITFKRLEDTLRKLDTQRYALERDLKSRKESYMENEAKTKAMRQTYMDWNKQVSPIQVELQQSEYALKSLREEKAALSSKLTSIEEITSGLVVSQQGTVQANSDKVTEIIASLPVLEKQVEMKKELLAKKKKELDHKNQELRDLRTRLLEVQKVVAGKRREKEMAEERELAAEIRVKEEMKLQAEIEAAKQRRFDAQMRAQQAFPAARNPNVVSANSDATDLLDSKGKQVIVAAMFDYEAMGEDELELKEDEHVIVLVPDTDGWCKGRIGTREGWFPANYVEPLSAQQETPQPQQAAAPMPAPVVKATPATLSTPTSQAAPKPNEGKKSIDSGNDRYLAIFDYTSADAEEVSFSEGDEIIVTEKNDDGWWTGRVVSSGVEGIFPSSYVKKAEMEGSRTAKAVYDYSPAETEDDGLSFKEDDIVRILQKTETGWWQGECNGKRGWFPSNYVEMLDDSKKGDRLSVTSPTLPDMPSPAAVRRKLSTRVSMQSEAASEKRLSREPEVEDIMEHYGQVEDVAAEVEQGGEIIARAMHDYDPVNEGDLELREGDTVKVLEKVNEGWWKGEFNGEIGMFPANYVEELGPDGALPDVGDESAEQDNGEKLIAKVMIAHQAGGDTELSLSVNDLIEVSDMSNDEWWEGTRTGRGKKVECGWFPANCVQLLSKRSGERRSTNPFEEENEEMYTNLRGMRVRALYDYAATNEDEITLNEGDVLTVLDRNEEGWWEGSIDNRTGWFPANYVEVIDEQESM
eukprot:Nk52_evm52s621 gene=Nk52_evmTU52s621